MSEAWYKSPLVHKANHVTSYHIENFVVEVLYVLYEGGAEDWGVRVWSAEVKKGVLYSELLYEDLHARLGSHPAAAALGFEWLGNSEGWANVG